MKKINWKIVAVVALIAYPLIPGLDSKVASISGVSIGSEMSRQIFIYALVGLGLNVVVGYGGLLQLGIAAFFAIGAVVTGILTVPDYPFQASMWVALFVSTVFAGMTGVALGAPTLRLRGDYLAIVTLGFGEIVRFALLNLDEITNGSRGLNPVPVPELPGFAYSVAGWFGIGDDWSADYRLFYYTILAILLLVVFALRNLEKSRLGRALVAIREDELAASCMGINVTRTKLIAFAIGAAIAGLAGCLFASRLQNTPGPNSYDFSISIMVLVCVIVGGLGNCYGAVLGAVLVFGFDSIACPILDKIIQKQVGEAASNPLLTFSNWRWLVYGLVLILVMRFRPGGLLPSREYKEAAARK